ncbi:hypothetical protein Sango_2113400 [Sesamum angolense]|uniref:MULE transposase domain-containing protein n=1 Tax=Sesamum angolense TaxID=2727404 RepID=A0AAE2BM55_9LAMI|nr:hypothetical protein Sango_2113400 [Sesamum angolense]
MGLSDGTEENKKFDRLYICFKALKEGFLSGCRPIIGVDGCHLKGPHGGILLTAVGIDPNNCLYPIAYAVVGSETKQSWEWFLMLLKEDLHILRNDIYTFISDKQKGLLPAFENIFPGADNRFCVRHLHGNMKTAGWKGLAYKRALWAAARATTVHEFDKCITEIGEMNVKCKEWLIEKPAAQWSRSHFNPWPKYDILLNNLCESFNSSILDAREKPILTMLEWIREYLMTKLQQNRDRATKKWDGKRICPKIKKLLDKNMDSASDCIPVKSNDWNYEISCYDGSRFTVDLRAHTCSCRRDFVHSCYFVQTYLKVYEPAMMPMNSKEMWVKTGYIPPLPPSFGKKRGQPKKTRKPSAGEDGEDGKKMNKEKKKETKMKRQGWKVHCKFCGALGHNKKGCQWRKFAEEFPPDEEQQRSQPQVPDEVTQGDDVPVQEVDTQSQLIEQTVAATKPKLTARKRTGTKNKGIIITEPSRASPRKTTIAKSKNSAPRYPTTSGPQQFMNMPPSSKAKKSSKGGKITPSG